MSKLIVRPVVAGPWAERNRHQQGLIWQRPDASRYNPDPEMAFQVRKGYTFWRQFNDSAVVET